ncbi:MAG TPA: glycosyltransferase family 4 protein [Fimbriimonas sp.]|nr:glycosyltransferase family 4 protein [Fimbriimonas sp.]
MILHVEEPEKATRNRPLRVALLSNYVPIQCGISTFAKNLRDSLARQSNVASVQVICVDDRTEECKFPEEVVFEIDKLEREQYRDAAAFVNARDFDVVCIQHEYGIFGGDAGDYLLDFVEQLRIPFIVTLHTILERPNPDQRRVLQRLAQAAQKVVVMSDKGKQILDRIYGILPHRISKIHHGVPDDFLSFESNSSTCKNTLLTFGLLSPDKGIEHVIGAMPDIVAQCPDAKYIVVGATHPHIRAHHGEAYRESLERLARDLGVDDNVEFVNRFLTFEEIVDYFNKSDIYITPYLKEEQITSGTLAYAIGSGKVVISTPYWYAEELLADGRGLLVPFRSPSEVADAVISVLTDSEVRERIERNASELGATMTWSAVGSEYTAMMSTLESEIQISDFRTDCFDDVPEVNLHHLRALTDETGLLQHARYSIPRYSEGYCIDDNARALLLTGMLQSSSIPPFDIDTLSARYLAFVEYALDPKSHKFRNFLSYSGEWLEEVGSEDSQGRALWCLAGFAARTQNSSQAQCAEELFKEAFAACKSWTSPRAWAYAILGIGEMYHAGQCPQWLRAECRRLSDQLSHIRAQSSSDVWRWFESSATYCNGRLPQALIVAGEVLNDPNLKEQGLESLEWLWNEQLDRNGFFEPLGCAGYHTLGGDRYRFDQQPVEAFTTQSACLTAWQCTSKGIWKERAWQAFNWFKGENFLRMPVFDAKTGACFDGLTENGMNQNQGAESTLSFLMACLEMKSVSVEASLDYNPIRVA